jgi:predicted protein tyrosine phosphatase
VAQVWITAQLKAYVERHLVHSQTNRLRSPTAEQIFADHPGIAVSSAGTNQDAASPLTAELVAWADMIVVMERQHRTKLQKRFRSALHGQRVICLDILDNYDFMASELVSLLQMRMAQHLPAIMSSSA